MVLAFVLISIAPGDEFRVLKKLKNVLEIDEVYPLFGEYDFLVKIVAEDFEEIGNILVNKIRIIRGVVATKTLTEAKFY
ncbi:MAG: Lrp/AsnC ligand binding domain-containing protein [Thermoplasmatales archaeon]|nr:MAG: Lrp/AsnC ligand binding domain-containing protein [Thermoplasmatales archaeon]